MVRLGLPYINVMLWLLPSPSSDKVSKVKTQMSNHKNYDATDQMLDATKR